MPCRVSRERSAGWLWVLISRSLNVSIDSRLPSHHSSLQVHRNDHERSSITFHVLNQVYPNISNHNLPVSFLLGLITTLDSSRI